MKSAVVSGNKVTITDQSNNTVEFVNSTYQIVTNAVDGLVPKYDSVDGTIDTQTTDWVLTNHNGTLGWYKLPSAAFNSSSVQLFVGAKSTSNNNNSNSATTNGNTYLKLFGNSTLKYQYNIKGTGLTTVISDDSGTITINTPTSHNQASSDINSLTGYVKATAIAAIAASDSLNTALGKLELKADTAYTLVAGAYDGDGTIENLAEILKVLEGISDTETIQAIIGKYLPLTGGTIYNSNVATPLYIKGATTSAFIGFQDKDAKTMGFIGMSGENSLKFCKRNGITNYDILHTGNYNSYAPTLTGTGASGTWGINISGTAAHATSAAALACGSFDTASQITTAYAQWANNSSCSDVPSMGYAAVLNVGYGNYRWWQIWNSRNDHQLFWRPEKSDASGWADVHTLIDDKNISNYLPVVTNYYWANVPISATSNSGTSPTFKNATTTGLLTVSSNSTHCGIKVGNNYINAINGELIIQNNTAIRFGDDSWYYNYWAGLKYVHSSKTISLGLADGTHFTANNA